METPTPIPNSTTEEPELYWMQSAVAAFGLALIEYAESTGTTPLPLYASILRRAAHTYTRERGWELVHDDAVTSSARRIRTQQGGE